MNNQELMGGCMEKNLLYDGIDIEIIGLIVRKRLDV